MLKSHLASIESLLLAFSQVAVNAGHPNLRGGHREWFIREFLENHLPSTLEIGKGEIIDARTQQVEGNNWRPVPDIVLYRRDFPKIQYSRDHVAFLAEGVLATIEVKSKLSREKLLEACIASKKHKELKREKYAFGGRAPAGSYPPITTYAVAYDGPENMSTVIGWLESIATEIGAASSQLVDLIVVFGKGVVFPLNSFKDSIRLERAELEAASQTFPRLANYMREFPDQNELAITSALASDYGDQYWIESCQRSENLGLLFAHLLEIAAQDLGAPSFMHYIHSMLQSGARGHSLFLKHRD